MADNFLNYTGLSYYHSKITSLFATKAETINGFIRGELADSTDLNTVTTGGVYHLVNSTYNSVLPTLINVNNYTGYLMVENYDDSTKCEQIYIHNTAICARRYDGTSWTTWNIYYKSDYTANGLARGSLDSNTDLDTIVDGGSYYISGTAAPTIINSPNNTAATVLVLQRLNTDTTLIKQFYFSNNNGDIYYRSHGPSTGWSKWYHFINSDFILKGQYVASDASTSINLNTFSTFGIYRVSGTSNYISNFPESTTYGILTVEKFSEDSWVTMQTFKTATHLYTRYTTNYDSTTSTLTWGSWNAFVSATTLDSYALSSSLSSYAFASSLSSYALSADLSSYALKASPTFTGTPKAPTAAAGTNTSQIATTAFVSTAITNALSGITGISYSVVSSLPATGSAGTIYLVSNSGSGQNIYDEYIYVNSAWEKIGTTATDLSGYWNSSNLTAITSASINALFS